MGATLKRKTSGRCSTVAASLFCLALAALPSRAAPEPPATLVLALDTSGSLTPADLASARELVTGILAALPPDSEVAVLSFDDEARLVLPRTTDPEAVRKAIDGLRGSGRYTALHDALFDASRYLRDAAGARRAILLVTDGRDENSALVLEDALKVARETLIPVFCVGVGRMDQRVLRRIAKLTGGDYFPAHGATAAGIAERILAAPEARAPAALPEPSPTVASASAPAPAPFPPAAPRASFFRSPLLWAGAGVLLLLAAVVLASAGRSRKTADAVPLGGPTRLDTGQGEALAGTVLARMPVEDEAIEKTTILSEKPVLEVTRGGRKGEVFRLSGASAISVGRAGANDIVLDDAAVSSQHCRIRPERGRFVLHDLKSTNGTRVNDQPATRHVLQEGDVIQVGETDLRFRHERRRGR